MVVVSCMYILPHGWWYKYNSHTKSKRGNMNILAVSWLPFMNPFIPLYGVWFCDFSGQWELARWDVSPARCLAPQWPVWELRLMNLPCQEPNDSNRKSDDEKAAKWLHSSTSVVFFMYFNCFKRTLFYFLFFSLNIGHFYVCLNGWVRVCLRACTCYIVRTKVCVSLAK